MKLANPQVGVREALAVYKVLRSGELTQGKISDLLQSEIQEYTNAAHAYVTSSATTALHIVLDCLDLEPKSEILVSDFSFPASGNAILKAGHIPKFIDIKLDTFNIDVSEIEKAITSNTRAIMPVYAFGAPAYLEQIRKIAEKYQLKIVADAACALGARYQGQDLNKFADATIFSFHPRKIITSGEGGVVITDDENLAERIRIRRSHGSIRTSSGLSFVDAGFNFRLSDLNSAVARVQLAKIENFLKKRKEIAFQYNQALRSTEVTVPEILNSNNHSYQSYVVLLNPSRSRNKVIESMRLEGIETTLGTYAMHSQPYFQNYTKKSHLKNSKYAQDHSLSLPMHTGMRKRDVQRVVEKLMRNLVEC
jgi:dTDP-4-amino-4,6-dideoxygalactose transaminase